MTAFLWWLLPWAVGAPVGCYALYIAARIIARTSRNVFLALEDTCTLMVEEAAYKLASLIIEGLGLALYYTAVLIRLLFWPLRFALKKAKDKKDNDPRWNGPRPTDPVRTDPVREAKAILGLHDGFTTIDLKTRYKHLMKRVHIDAGGTDWLAARVNWARDVLDKAV
jgi:hypothetical protein